MTAVSCICTVASATSFSGDFCLFRRSRRRTEFGFWELSRVAVEYKALFGEAPFETLRSRVMLAAAIKNTDVRETRVG